MFDDPRVYQNRKNTADTICSHACNDITSLIIFVLSLLQLIDTCATLSDPKWVFIELH